MRMKPRAGEVQRVHKAQHSHLEGRNWVLIAGGALLSTLTVRLACKLKQALTPKRGEDTSFDWKGRGRTIERRRPASVHSNSCTIAQDDDFSISEVKDPHHQKLQQDPGYALPLVTVPASEFSKENGVAWVSSPEHLELPPRPFHHSNCSDSPCVSECGSDIFSKREVVQKLRHQLKKRDDMILEMHDQISGLQNSLNRQLCLSSNLQTQLDAANNELLNSERELQHLRKVIADRCLKQTIIEDKLASGTVWPSETMTDHSNGFLHEGQSLISFKRSNGDIDKIEMLKKEVVDLKEVVEGKEFLLQSYKEQKAELSIKIKEMQQRLDSQVPNIL